MSDNTDKRTATQRIEDLERVVSALYNAASQQKSVIENLLTATGEMGLVKDALKLLNKKTEAIIQVAAAETGITFQSVSDSIVKMNVVELTSQVAAYVANGHLEAASEVSDNSYLVAEELAADGSVANPRIQFRLDSQDPATQEALKGKKAGETVSFGENKLSAKILEVYSIVEPKSEQAAEAAPAEVAAEAPAAEAAAPAQDTLPAETPVAEFVTPDPNAPMMTASES